MKFTETAIRGAFLVELEQVEDERGFFARTWCAREFAAHRGVSRRVVQDIERGTGNPTVDSLNSVAKLFGLQVGFVPIRRNESSSPSSS